MENPYCSCTLTRLQHALAQAIRKTRLAAAGGGIGSGGNSDPDFRLVRETNTVAMVIDETVIVLTLSLHHY